MGSNNNVKSLPQSELEIIKALWAVGEPVSAAELNAFMKKGWRVQTLITHLSRMVVKGAVICERREVTRGARYFYIPAIDKQTYIEQETDTFVSKIHDDNIKSLMDALAKTGKISKKDAEYLASIAK